MTDLPAHCALHEKMKRILQLAILLLSAIAAEAQTKSISLELLGSSGMAGINYDARLKDNVGLGYSIGLGYGLNGHSDFTGYKSVSHIIGVPVELNYLFGKKNCHLVLGAGVFNGIDINHTHTPSYIFVAEDGSGPLQEEMYSHNVKWVFSPFADIAFRVQKPKGFTFSIGVKPNMTSPFWPYVYLGKSF